MSECSRREFMWRVAAAGCLAATGAACARVPTVAGAMTGDKLTISEADYVAAAGDSPGVILTVPGQRETVILMRDEQGGYMALSGRCTHKGCQVQPGERELKCPCHGSVFGLDGKPTQGPARDPLPVYEATLSQGVISVAVSL